MLANDFTQGRLLFRSLGVLCLTTVVVAVWFGSSPTRRPVVESGFLSPEPAIPERLESQLPKVESPPTASMADGTVNGDVRPSAQITFVEAVPIPAKPAFHRDSPIQRVAHHDGNTSTSRVLRATFEDIEESPRKELPSETVTTASRELATQQPIPGQPVTFRGDIEPLETSR